ncbi:LTA synthase family protein [Nisaea sediminum]|uniref:LTA synthase family protein n=1 Tax=Nisaea sediminum TaxID=2775867 RepID=UPI001866C185|nr:LTA synthase family protein [Nisaea sediminum]
MTRGMRRLIWIGAAFFLVSMATRIGLALFSGQPFEAGQWVRIISVGSIYDLAVAPWLLLPWALYEAIMPDLARSGRLARWEALWAMVWAGLYLSLFAVTAIAEFAFWAEFASRFDFIAVDYLIYTHEVIGNIRESYPVALWFAIIAGGAGIVTWFSWPRMARATRSGLRARVGIVAALSAAAGGGAVFLDTDLADAAPNAFVAQLSSNGIYSLGHAYRHNQLDYDKYYPSLPLAEADSRIRRLVAQPNASFKQKSGIEREVSARVAGKDLNVVLISVESLSAEFLGRFGNGQNLTPELDRLAAAGLEFTRLYATGTRTVRGLEALSIGTPPTPGQSIVRRPNNNSLENLGEELGENGWTPYWIYGGYGFFDNMNAYFGSNGYKVVDRTDLEAAGLTPHAENIWGIADEDLFSLTIATLDRAHAEGQRFFAHVMTTSNHRPYTFPEDRIDLPQGKREGAVKYTDWAIGDFIRRSASKPWFDNTLFIITADHTSKAAGKTDLPLDRYHIPMIWYAPKVIEPSHMDRLMSQIDVGPSLMGWLGMSYSSRFFGYDIFALEEGRERAFISTYQKLGYLSDGRLVILDVNRPPEIAEGLPVTAGAGPSKSDDDLIADAIAWYQSASHYFRQGDLREDEKEGAS